MGDQELNLDSKGLGEVSGEEDARGKGVLDAFDGVENS